MRHIWSVVAEMAITSQETRNISLIETLETITLTVPAGTTIGDFDSIPIRSVLVSTWVRSEYETPELGYARTLVVDPDGKRFEDSQLEYEIDLKRSIRFRGSIVFQEMPYTRNGIYSVLIQEKIDHQWHEVASVPLLVVVKTADDA